MKGKVGWSRIGQVRVGIAVEIWSCEVGCLLELSGDQNSVEGVSSQTLDVKVVVSRTGGLMVERV